MAVADRLQKVYGLDFLSDMPAIPDHLPAEYSVHKSALLRRAASSTHAHRTSDFDRDGRPLCYCLVDHLEGKILGESLGDCHEHYLYSAVRAAVHYSLTARAGPPSGGSGSGNYRTGRFSVA